MNIETSMKVGALFKLIVHKGDPKKPTKETPLFHNLVLDAGLDRLSTGDAIPLVCVGTGNSTPVPTQTSLDSFLASSSDITDRNGLIQTGVEPYYYGGTRTYRFGEGVAAGNLSEIGLGWTNSNLFNRALIKDSGGNPTTITILADEYLDVVVELRVYPQRSFTGSFNLLNKLGDVLSTHTVTGFCWISSGASPNMGKVELGYSNYGERLWVFSGDTNSSINNIPSGTSFVSAILNTSYPIPRSCRATGVYRLQEANFNHKSFSIPVRNLGTGDRYIGYKWQIDPPISKNNTQEIQYTVTLSWDRYEPT